MAKAPATPTPAADEVEPPKKKGKKLRVVILIVIAALVIAGAGLIGLLLLKKGSAGDAEGPGSGAASGTGVDLSRPPSFVALEPFVVNLLPGEGDRYLQVVLAVRVADARTGDSLKGFMPEIRHRINMLLSNKLPSELSTYEGRETLANDITDEINRVLGGDTSPTGRPEGPVRAVLFNSFIIQ
jgi:flagellar protein FliL